MSRHSRHSNDRSFFTAKERADAGYSVTKKEVLGSDCFLPFGHCCISLKAPKTPVVTPEGYIYDREFILEYLLTQKLELQAKRKSFEEQEARKARKEAQTKVELELKVLEDFQKVDQGLLSEDHRHKRAMEKDKPVPGAPDDDAAKRRKKNELLVIDKSVQREKCFWVKETTQTAAPAEVKDVEDVTPKCPMSGKKLRVKDLLPVNFEVADEQMLKEGGGKGVFCCAVSKHPITHQQAYLIKPSGQVVMESVLKDMVFKDMVCPITGKKLKGKQDVLKLQQGGTGFSAHNDVQAKAYSAIRSHTADARNQQGHLPRAGYCGLH